MTRSEEDEHDRDEAVRQASAWFARLRAAEPTETVRRDFRAWLAENPRNHEAFRSVKALWYALDRPARLAGADAWYRRGLGQGRRRRKVRSAVMAASVCLLGLCSIAFWRDEGLVDRALADYATQPGQQRKLRLADGSAVHLDGDSAIDASMDAAGRSVRLIRGRAWFDVAHDPARPFVVRAGKVETRVLGTAFAIDADAGTVEVAVERGDVAVSAGGGRLELAAGESVSFAHDRLGEKQAVDIETGLAWRRGLLVMNHTPLEKVARELSRMSSGRVLLRDGGGLPETHLSGVFRVDDPDAVIAALKAASLHAVRIPGVATLIYR